MSDPTARNRLDEEESPYLRQHADNPVDWQPWDERALEAARERDVPIFLSVGYSACHWCHVMEEESFEDEDVATILNEEFVPIKVDREERPDLDRLYQTICQQVSGRGGWPLSAWLTPDGRPFYVGTYFPKEPRRGSPGFRSLLEDIVESWNDPDEREEIETRADRWSDAVSGELEDVPEDPGDAPDADLAERAAGAALRGADRQHGGWGGGPKFPHAGRLHLLGRAYEDTGRDAFREVVTETLDAMADGGMYDQLGGGFHRYSTDERWVVPHFEKMLYDNAELPRAYLMGYQLTGEDRYATVVEETLEFITRELQGQEGGFYSTLDAQSEGEEGTFYVWTSRDVEDAIDDETRAELFREFYGVTESGNFEGGTTVLTRATDVETLSDRHEMDESQVRERLANARETALAAREERPRPRRDEKILAGWNGLAISAFAEADLVLHGDYLGPATEALDFVREELFDPETGDLTRRWADGVAKIDGYLEDYAFLARGAFDCYQAGGDVEHLAFALELADAIEESFWDENHETLYFTAAGGEELIARPQELTDQSTPSSAGVAASVLLQLSHFRPHDRYETIAESVLTTHSNHVRSNPLQHASLTLAADRFAQGSLELTLVADELPGEWRRTVSETYLPRQILARRPASEDTFGDWLDRLNYDDAPPIWRGRGPEDGKPTVYACESFACSPPKHSLAEALEWADSGPI